MTKRRHADQEKLTQRFSKEGRGRGSGSSYTPWYRIQDKSTFGLATRIYSPKTQRMHHLLTKFHRSYFLWNEWRIDVEDIRENYPLDINDTAAIARQFGLRHPRAKQNNKPKVMITDFVLTVRDASGTSLAARSLSRNADVGSSSLPPKLEIERRYWNARGIDWAIVTESQLPRNLVANADLLRGYIDVRNRLGGCDADLHMISLWLTCEILACSEPLRQITTRCDHCFELPMGTGITIAYHLLATRQWKIDMNVRIEPGKRMLILSSSVV